MAVGHRVSRDNLEFHWDMRNRKSFKGKPTTNLCYHMNALHEPKDNISFHQYSTDATFHSNHPGRLLVNTPTATRSSAVNTGANSGNWQASFHGYWKWDYEKKKAVFYMNDEDGQWKANSFGLGQSFNDYGLSAGDTYSISWDSWTSRVDKAANAGVYMRNTSGSNGFYAGQSNSQTTAKNTIPFKWQRVYAVFTVPTGMNMDHNLAIYCYGHYTGRGVVKMDNVQFELGTPSYFVADINKQPISARSSTESLIDISGNNTITINSFDYQNDGSFVFSDENHYASVSGTLATGCDGNVTMMGWFKQLSRNGPHQTIVCTNTGYRQGIKLMSAYHGQGGAVWVANSDGTDSTLINTGGTTLENTGIHHIAATRDSSSGAIKVYLDGVLVNSGTGVTGDVSNTSTTNARIGLEYHSGGYGANSTIYDTKVYSRVLTLGEISNIYKQGKGYYDSL